MNTGSQIPLANKTRNSARAHTRCLGRSQGSQLSQ